VQLTQITSSGASRNARSPAAGLAFVSGNHLLILLFISLAYFLVRLPWLVCLPTCEAPDEANHLWVVQFLHDHLRLPTMTDLRAAGAPAEYGALPPFGYLCNLLTSAFFHGDNLRLASRFGTLMAGYPTVLFAYALGQKLFTSRILAVVLPMLVVVHPQLVFSQSYTNNDGLAITLCSATVYFTVVGLTKGISTSRAALLGFLVGWAALSKTNSMALIPAVLYALWTSCREHGNSKRHFFKLATVLTAACVLTSGWFYVRNYLEFSGDCLGSRTMIAMWQTILPHVHGKPVFPWPAINTLAWWRYVFFDFWGLFGFMNRYLWRPLYFLFFGLVIIAGIGWTIRPKLPEEAASDQSVTSSPASTSIWQFLTVCACFNLMAVIYATLSGLSGPHGRYLFTSELAITSLLLGGFARFGPRAQSVLSSLLLALCIASTAYGWWVYYAGKTWF
jgi:hypothetical protein